MFGYKVHPVNGSPNTFVIFQTKPEVVDAKTGKINDVKWDDNDHNVLVEATYIARLVDEDEAKKLVMLLNK